MLFRELLRQTEGRKIKKSTFLSDINCYLTLNLKRVLIEILYFTTDLER